ncbi:hypothetical protein P43SY_000739 [Pythium insidiosum]|uniref:Surfeit locus protein 2 n=1 Tax=Pythium insidiosum TaxID=114742 RepID=A0AAD5M8T4_PYTIN|nr:hypothetical protein P43SY_000739 [Pythium insidiosum]
MMAVDDDVKALLAEHSYLQLVETGEGEQKRVRVRCDLLQHEMLPRKDVIEAYLKSKKFVKAKEWYCYDYSQYEPYIVAHRRKPKCLYCNVTNTVLNRIPAEVEKHVNGKRFKRLKDQVKFETRATEDDDAADTFDANAFEFEHQQLIYSDDEEEADGKGGRGEDDEEDEDDDAEEEDEDEEDEEDDIMADFRPKEGDDEEEDEHIKAAVARITQKKRKSPAADDDEEEEEEEEEAEAKPTPAKKAKKASKPATNAPRKERRQPRKRSKAGQ